MVKEVDQEPPAVPEPSSIHPYSVGDPIPVPEVVESDTDTVWALWQKSLSPDSDGANPAFESTVPAELPTLPPSNSTLPPGRGP
jgi:hypothetical protein